jgi:hypothetical protein
MPYSCRKNRNPLRYKGKFALGAAAGSFFSFLVVSLHRPVEGLLMYPVAKSKGSPTIRNRSSPFGQTQRACSSHGSA